MGGAGVTTKRRTQYVCEALLDAIWSKCLAPSHARWNWICIQQWHLVRAHLILPDCRDLSKPCGDTSALHQSPYCCERRIIGGTTSTELIGACGFVVIRQRIADFGSY